MPPKTSTLTKGTSVSDSRRQGAQAQRALSDNRREIRPADLAKAAGIKRGRENEEATAPTSKAVKLSYGRVLIPLASGSQGMESGEALEAPGKSALSDTVSSGGSFGSTGSRRGGARKGGAAPPPSMEAAPPPPPTTTTITMASAITKGTFVKKAPTKALRVPAAAVPSAAATSAAATAPPAYSSSAAAGGSGSGSGSGSGDTESLCDLEEMGEGGGVPVIMRSGAGVAGDFMFEDGEHLVFKDKRWEKDALPVAKRLLAKAKYGGSAEEFRSFALRLIIKRVALENYIKSHHEELRKEVATAKAAAVTAATQKAVSESNAVADFAKQITASKKEAAKWHALADSIGAELESLKAASQAQGAEATATLEAEVARLTGEVAALKGECGGMRGVYEAEVAAAVAAGEAAVAEARAQGAAAVEEERRARVSEGEAAAAAAASRAEAPVRAALEGVQGELSSALAALKSAEAAKGAAALSLQALRQQVSAKEGEIAELEEGLAAAVGEAEECEARCKELAAGLAKATEEAGMWQGRWANVDAKRAALLEQNLSLKGAIRVFARVRPPLPGEDVVAAAAAASSSSSFGGGAKKGGKQPSSSPSSPPTPSDPLFNFPSATADDATDLEVCELPGAGIGGYGKAEEGRRTAFKLQRVFPPTSGQGEVFSEVEGLVQSALDGHRVGIFAYGQTGSGKTWTMEGERGSAAQAGIIPRSVDLVFERCARMAEQGWSTGLSVEMLEIHNETIRDLLTGGRGGGGGGSGSGSGSSAAPSPALDIKHDSKGGSPRVDGLSTHPVTTASAVHALLARASSARSTGTTAMNERSSRSHMVFTLRITSTHGSTRQTRGGVLHLVDLAGSERLDKSRVNDAKAGGSAALLTETKNINSSLLTLGTCISALQAKATHVPYRDSKLTDLLSETLGGKDARTLILCTLNPLHSNVSESLSTLNFAKKCTAVGKA